MPAFKVRRFQQEQPRQDTLPSNSIISLEAKLCPIHSNNNILIHRLPNSVRSPEPTVNIPPLAEIGNPSSVPDADPAIRPSQPNWSSISHRERGGRASSDDPLPPLGDEEAYELVEYPDADARKAARKETDKAEERRQEKRARKRQWLEQQDEMKFSHSIQFNAVPDWSSHYIAYSKLKKL